MDEFLRRMEQLQKETDVLLSYMQEIHTMLSDLDRRTTKLETQQQIHNEYTKQIVAELDNDIRSIPERDFIISLKNRLTGLERNQRWATLGLIGAFFTTMATLFKKLFAV
ncbi:MAG: hypothetical protein E6R03_08155 [Hyphomicrobiaceae bacterium]|nr:MAG: hypothetical protein E6R03_08155 [Hyphomicrobiaceae bacterium]